ncbi:hypothetical protein MMC28_006428 [Mycoblastus sanguinarius]|nr:hypothetical protein [Mycoblastus sanguinarius]
MHIKLPAVLLSLSLFPIALAGPIPDAASKPELNINKEIMDPVGIPRGPVLDMRDAIAEPVENGRSATAVEAEKED